MIGTLLPKPFSRRVDDRHRRSVWLIDQYKRWISPFLPSACRFAPTCSEYAKECFKRYGWFKAFYLSSRRLLRCHPYHPGGIDPVP